jgi:hypothetical protein
VCVRVCAQNYIYIPPTPTNHFRRDMKINQYQSKNTTVWSAGLGRGGWQLCEPAVLPAYATSDICSCIFMFMFVHMCMHGNYTYNREREMNIYIYMYICIGNIIYVCVCVCVCMSMHVDTWVNVTHANIIENGNDAPWWSCWGPRLGRGLRGLRGPGGQVCAKLPLVSASLSLKRKRTLGARCRWSMHRSTTWENLRNWPWKRAPDPIPRSRSDSICPIWRTPFGPKMDPILNQDFVWVVLFFQGRAETKVGRDGLTDVVLKS